MTFCWLVAIHTFFSPSFCKTSHFPSRSPCQQQVVRASCSYYYMAGEDSVGHHCYKPAVVSGHRLSPHLASPLFVADAPAFIASIGVFAVAALLKYQLRAFFGWVVPPVSPAKFSQAPASKHLDLPAQCRGGIITPTAVASSFHDADCVHRRRPWYFVFCGGKLQTSRLCDVRPNPRVGALSAVGGVVCRLPHAAPADVAVVYSRLPSRRQRCIISHRGSFFFVSVCFVCLLLGKQKFLKERSVQLHCNLCF